MNDDIEPASLDQLKRGANGRMTLIEADVGDNVRQIKEVNKNLFVRYSDAGGYFVVFYRHPVTLKERLVTTAKELDGRLVNRIRRLNSDSYDYIAELEKLDSAAEQAKLDAEKERIGDLAERLAHALRKDLGVWKDSARSKQSWGKGLVGH